MNTLKNRTHATPAPAARLTATLCLALAGWSALPVHAGTAVVVGSSNSATALTAEQASQIFLARVATLPGGVKAVLIDQPEGSPRRDQFYSKMAGKNPAQMKALWSRLTFSGMAQPPTVMAGDAEVKKAVGADPGAIGYIDSAAVDTTVKVLLTID
jgi:ABC-type phosphate transport system substrate-binding protein